MDAATADQIFRFARWETCLAGGILGFAAALLWLCANADLDRRRISAFIDFVWTSLSVIGIATALVVFGDLTWKANAERQTDQMHLAWDKLAAIDGPKLVALNCANGQPTADALLNMRPGLNVIDTPCMRASQILHWRIVEDLGITKIKHACPARDLKFSTRDYEWTSNRFLGVSCLGATECHRARCEQEQAAGQILIAADTSAGKPLVADSTLSEYRSSLQDAFKLSRYDVYERTHPIKYAATFYILVPFWAFLLGARLARSTAELLDPTQKARFCASWLVPKSAATVPPPQVVTEPVTVAESQVGTQSVATDFPAADLPSVQRTEAP